MQVSRFSKQLVPLAIATFSIIFSNEIDAQTSLNLGNVSMGTTATYHVNFTFSENNPACANEGLSGPDASDFSVNPNYGGTTFQDGQTYSSTITFTPSHLGVETATVTFNWVLSQWFLPWTWTLTGTGTPAATITPLRVTWNQADQTPPANVDVPIVPLANPAVLDSGQVQLGAGVVADGVTPVLFMITGTPGTYSLNLPTTDAGSSANVTYSGGSLANNLYVLNGSQWTVGTSITIPNTGGITGTAYAYLGGMTWSSFACVTPPANQVNATLTLNSGSTPVATANFGIRPVPIVLVHGIADTGATWTMDFLAALQQNVPAGFIRVFSYGQPQPPNDNPFSWPCTQWDLNVLSPEVDSDLHGIEQQLSANWDFTRYDAVGHSQGGVLLRMLCEIDATSGASPFTSDNTSVVSSANFERGRFRRVVTIGSPHNGSTLMYYAWGLYGLTENNLFAGPPNLYDYLVRAAKKFRPDGYNIRQINDPRLSVNTNIGFCCMQATIAGGNPPLPNIFQNPDVYNDLFLQDPYNGGDYTIGELLIPRGSDGVVDTVSQGGGPGTPVDYYDDVNIAHANPLNLAPLAFGVPANATETASADIGEEVATLLSGSANRFGPFKLPIIISDSDKSLYDALIAHELLLLGDTIQQTPSPRLPTANINYVFTIPTNLPLAGAVNWHAFVYGPNGVSTNGLSMQVNTNDTAIMSLSIEDGTTGEVVISAAYMATNGTLVFASPLIVDTVPPTPGAILTNIELEPSSVSLEVGNATLTQIWGDYTGGVRSLLYAIPNQVNYVSSNPQVAGVDADGCVTLNSRGTAIVSVSYAGLISQMEVSSAAPVVPQMLFSGETDGGFRFALLTSPGITNIVEASTNCTDWTPLAELLPTNAFTSFMDSNMNGSQHRFYRIMIPAISTNLTIGN